MEKDRNTFRVKTTSFEAEDFYLDTTLTPEEIRSVILPMKKEEETSDAFYSTEEYANKVKQEYPNDVVIYYTEMDEIII